jgi:Ca-activated chloride channel family protein
LILNFTVRGFASFLLFIPLFIKDIRKQKRKGIKVPTVKNMAVTMDSAFVLLKISKYIILSALIIAMARPRTFTVSQDRDDTKGDRYYAFCGCFFEYAGKGFNSDRLTALKDIAVKFVKNARMTESVWLPIPEKRLPKFR